MIEQGLEQAGITGISPVSAYIKGLPFNMYSIFTLIFVGMLMYTGRDYGPMLKAEVRALKTGQYTKPDANPMLDVGNELGETHQTNDPLLRPPDCSGVYDYYIRYHLHGLHKSGQNRHRHYGNSRRM